MDLSRIILCGHWGFHLEEAGEDKQVVNKRVVMRIRGIRADGGWIISSPVTEIHIMDFGLEAWTENSDEIYGLRVHGYGWWSLEWFGLWGTEREKWANLAEGLPGKLQVFAWMWQDPLCGYIEDWEWAGENIRKANEWKNRHKIETDSDSLCAIALCLKKAGQTRGGDRTENAPGFSIPQIFFSAFMKIRPYFLKIGLAGRNVKYGDMPVW